MSQCNDVVEAFALAHHHCESCHQDDDDGNGPMALLIATDDEEIEVCCDVRHALEGFALQRDLADVVQARMREWRKAKS